MGNATVIEEKLSSDLAEFQRQIEAHRAEVASFQSQIREALDKIQKLEGLELYASDLLTEVRKLSPATDELVLVPSIVTEVDTESATRFQMPKDLPFEKAKNNANDRRNARRRERRAEAKAKKADEGPDPNV